MKTTSSFFFSFLFGFLALFFLSGCSNKDVAIAKKDYREIKDYKSLSKDVTQAITDGLNHFASKKAENFDAWERAAEKGSPEGQFLLGRCSQDRAKMANWFRKAAENGLAEAQYRFGECLYYGWGVPKDETEATKWLRKASEQGEKRGDKLLRK